MRFRIVVASLVLAGCINFDDPETAFCNNATPEQRATACTDRLGSEPTGLSIMGMPASLRTGACSGAIRIQTVDGAGAKAVVRAETPVGLRATPSAGVTFYSDTACTIQMSSVTMTAGGDSVLFAFKSDTTGSLRINAYAQGLTDGIGDVQIEHGNLALTTAAQSPIAGSCSGVVAVQSQDSYGNVVIVDSPTVLSLSASPSIGVVFYSDATCATGITETIIPPGTSSASFYFKATNAGAITITVSSTDLTAVTQVETVRAGAATKLAFATMPITLTAGVCSTPVTVQSRDPYGNVANVSGSVSVTLSASSPSNLIFYVDSNCNVATPRVTIIAGESSVSFYYRDTMAGLVTITASASGYDSDFIDNTIRAASPWQIKFTSASQTISRNILSGPVTFAVQDEYGNASPLSSQAGVEVTVGTVINNDYFCSSAIACSNAGCCTCNCGCSCVGDYVFVAADQFSGSFWFKRGTVGPATLTIRVLLPNSGVTVTATQPVTIT